MLRKKQQELLLTLYSIIKNEAQTTQELSQHLNLSKRKIKERIKELNQILENYTNLKEFIQLTSTGTVNLDNSDQYSNLIIFYKIKLVFLKKSYNFQIMTHIFITPKLTILQLSERMYLSESYIRRLIRKINQFLLPFEFQILEDESYYLDFSGNELVIRLVLFVLFSDAFQTLEWPFNQKVHDEKITTKVLKEDPTFSFLFTITVQRQLSKNKLYPINKNFFPLLRELEQYTDLTSTFKALTPFQISFLDNFQEVHYLTILFHIFFPNLIPHTTKLELGYVFSTMKDNTITLFVYHLIEELWHVLDLSEEDNKNLITYYLVTFTTFIGLLDKKVNLFPQLIFPKPTYTLTDEDIHNTRYKKILQFLQKFIEQHSKSTLAKMLKKNKFLCTYFVSFLYKYTEISSFPTLFIYVNMKRELSANDFVKKRLRAFFNDETIVFCTDLTQADLIITDHLVTKSTLYSVFHLDKIDEKKQWGQLFTCISELVLKKLKKTERKPIASYQ